MYPHFVNLRELILDIVFEDLIETIHQSAKNSVLFLKIPVIKKYAATISMFMHFGNSQKCSAFVYRLRQGGQEEEGEGEEEREEVGTDNTAMEEVAGEREEEGAGEGGEGKREEGGGDKTHTAKETNSTTIHKNCQIYTQKDRENNNIRAQ